jgi:hypothetical protein
MKKKNLLFLGSSIFCIATAAFTLNAIRNVGSSYAVGTDGYPNTDFTTNVDTLSPTTINLVGDALGSGSSAGLRESFKAVKDVSYDGYPLYVLTKNKMTPTESETFELGDETVNPINISDEGLKRILQVGYAGLDTNRVVFKAKNHGSVTNSEKYYITQLAIWMYIYKNSSRFASTYCANNGCAFINSDTSQAITYTDVNAALTTAISSNPKLEYVKDILAEAEASDIIPNGTYVSANSTGLGTYNFNNDYILTGEFKVSGFENDFVAYNINVVDPNHYGIYLTDASGNKVGNGTSLRDLGLDTVLKLHIPISGNLEEMDLDTSGVNYTIYTLYDNNFVPRAYKVTDTRNLDTPLIAPGASKTESYSDVLFGMGELKPNPGQARLHNFTVISKIDATNQQEIGGAHLEIYKGSDMNSDFTAHSDGATAVESWVSQANETKKLFLDDGTYGLCETIFPDGYGINEAGEQIPTCIEMTVNNGTVNVTQMENFPIPNTGLFSSKIGVAIGGGLIIIGIMGMVVVLGNGKKNKKQEQQQAI